MDGPARALWPKNLRRVVRSSDMWTKIVVNNDRFAVHRSLAVLARVERLQTAEGDHPTACVTIIMTNCVVSSLFQRPIPQLTPSQPAMPI